MLSKKQGNIEYLYKNNIGKLQMKRNPTISMYKMDSEVKSSYSSEYNSRDGPEILLDTEYPVLVLGWISGKVWHGLSHRIPTIHSNVRPITKYPVKQDAEFDIRTETGYKKPGYSVNS